MVINRLISKIVFAGLLLGTLPMSLPLHGQTQKSVKFTELQIEVKQKTAGIQAVVKKIKTTKKALPVILGGVGVVTMLLLIAVAATVGFALWKSKLLRVAKKKTDFSALIDETIKEQHDNMLDDLYNIRNDIIKFFNKGSDIKPLLKGSYTEAFINPAAFIEKYKVSGDLKTLLLKYREVSPTIIYGEKLAEEVLQFEKIKKAVLEINKPKLDKLEKELLSTTESLTKPIKITKSLALGSFIVALFGIVGTAAGSLGLKFGLSSASVAAAFRDAKRIEQIKKEYPDILTAQQEKVLAQLKKLSKNMMVRSLIKNLRLEDALKTAVNIALQQNPTLFGRQRKARRIFAKYIKLSWQKELFTKALAQSANKIKKIFVKMQLRRVNRKLARMKRWHPKLKGGVLNDAVQMYATEANGILQELKNQIMKKKAGAKPKMTLKPVIQL